MCKLHRNNVNSHNELRRVISSASRLDLITGQTVRYIYDKFSEKFFHVYDIVYPIIEGKKILLDISKQYVTAELENLIREKT